MSRTNVNDELVEDAMREYGPKTKIASVGRLYVPNVDNVAAVLDKLESDSP